MYVTFDAAALLGPSSHLLESSGLALNSCLCGGVSSSMRARNFAVARPRGLGEDLGEEGTFTSPFNNRG